MLVTAVLTCTTALGIASVLLFTVGHRVKRGSRVAALTFALVVALVAGELAARLWLLPSRYVLTSECLLLGVVAVIVATRPMWNPVGQLFFGAMVASSLSYLVLSGWATTDGGLSPLAVVGSSFVWLLEALALLIAGSFAFESCDVMCRTRWDRTTAPSDPSYRPKVSLHVPAYAEPPDMLIETIATLEQLDYPDFEIVVIDNNTKDEELWRPVEEYCTGRTRIRFVHVDPWHGYKSGALNLALSTYTDPDAELVGVVDADYLVSPEYLDATVGYFADPNLAFLQTPQDYREWEGDTYLTACHDSYKYFFETAMPSRNERNSIIFGGTMGLIRRSVLEGLGGWDEWCITEDAEASLRMLHAGWSGLYINQSFGQGIMPLSFAALKRQMFRWCFGGIQILRKHHKILMPWNRGPDNRLSTAQRLDYLMGGLQWFGHLVSLGFTAVLLISGMLLAATGHVFLSPLLGAAVLLPLTVLVSGLLRAMWALRHRCGITYRRAVLAFLTWLSLSWTVGLACIQALARSEGVFLRTPKWRGRSHLTEALRSAHIESLLAAGSCIAGGVLLGTPKTSLVVAALFLWQGAIYAAAPTVAWLNQRSELSVRLERRRRAEERWDRFSEFRPHLARASVAVTALGLIATLSIGAAQAGHHQARLFSIPQASPGDNSPLGNFGLLPNGQASRQHTTINQTTSTTTNAGSSANGGTTTAGLNTPSGAGLAGGSQQATPTTVALTKTSTPTATTTPTAAGSTTTTRPGSSPTSVTTPGTTKSPPTSTSPQPVSPTTSPHRP